MIWTIEGKDKPQFIMERASMSKAELEFYGCKTSYFFSACNMVKYD
jgi:hypothetical protein